MQHGAREEVSCSVTDWLDKHMVCLAQASSSWKHCQLPARRGPIPSYRIALFGGAPSCAESKVHMSNGSVTPAGYRVDELTELRQREKELGIAPDPAVDAYMKVGSDATQLQSRSRM